MSLRARLSVIVTLLYVVGLLLGAGFLVASARQRVAEEVSAAAILTSQLLEPLFIAASLTQDQATILERMQNIDPARHLDVYLEVEDDGIAPEQSLVTAAPSWFVYLVQPPPMRFAVTIGDDTGKRLLIRTNPAHEIDEVWTETRTFINVLSLILLIANSLLYITVGRWLEPVGAIVASMNDAERGDFSGRVSPGPLPEMKAITDKLNQFTTVLRNSKEENDRLTQMSVNIRENERRHLARELHDQMGQSISAVKAIAFSLAQRLRGTDDTSADAATRISTISNEIGGHVRNMMGRLRPALLDELGFVAAVQAMIDEWNRDHRESFCSCDFRGVDDFGALDPEAQINLYRIVQEALTNVARHAQAEWVEVSLSAANRRYTVVVADNGRGYSATETPQGMGLTGIRERSQALNGTLFIVTAPGAGVRIELTFGR
jgi:two-component system sensor histidine kinase UhpB